METPVERLDAGRMTTTTTNVEPTRTVFHPDPTTIRRAIERRSVATLATASATGRPHAATVLYQYVDDALFVSTDRDSRKARNIADHGVAAVNIAVRRLPIGPPASIQFQCSAAVLANNDPEIIRLAAAGQLDRITGHGELDLDGACFLRLALPTRVVTYAMGMSLWRVIRNPLDAAGEVNLLPSDDRAATEAGAGPSSARSGGWPHGSAAMAPDAARPAESRGPETVGHAGR